MSNHRVATVLFFIALHFNILFVKPTIEKEYIAKYKKTLVIDCKFNHNATDSIVNNVRLSSDKSKILAYINGQERVILTGNYKATAAKLTMSIERRSANHLRIYFEETPRSLNNVSLLCYTTTDRGMGTHLMEIKNVILLMQAPKIAARSFRREYVVKEGALHRPNVSCNASALPAPVVEWYGPTNRLISSSDDWGRGSSTLIGGIQTRLVRLKLPAPPITRQWAGVYRCEAKFRSEDQRRISSNPEDKKEFKLTVYYKPRISMTERVVYSDVGATEKVKINVDAVPLPTVRCGLISLRKPPLAVRSSRSKAHTVDLMNIRPSDVGDYRCNASNSMGTDSIVFSLSITPPTPTILSAGGETEYSDYYKLKWATDSRARLRNVTASIHVKQQNGTLVLLRNQSKKLDVSKGNFHFHLTNLSHNTEHEVRARVCSHHACSDFSPPHTFRTRQDKAGWYTVPPRVYRVQAISEESRGDPPGAVSSLRPSWLTLLLLLLLLLLANSRQ